MNKLEELIADYRSAVEDRQNFLQKREQDLIDGALKERDQLHFRLIKILNDLEKEIVKPVEVDAGGIVTNHMAAVWAARDAMNELFEVEPVA